MIHIVLNLLCGSIESIALDDKNLDDRSRIGKCLNCYSLPFWRKAWENLITDRTQRLIFIGKLTTTKTCVSAHGSLANLLEAVSLESTYVGTLCETKVAQRFANDHKCGKIQRKPMSDGRKKTPNSFLKDKGFFYA